MQTKLTLRMETNLIRRAKAHARRTGKSVSMVVANYFAALDDAGDNSLQDLPPKVKSLIGVLGRSRPGEQDYRRYLERKHK